MISHFCQIHNEHGECDKDDVVESPCSRLLEKHIYEHDKVDRTVAPQRQPFKKCLSCLCDVRLQVYLKLNTPVKEGLPIGKLHPYKYSQQY